MIAGPGGWLTDGLLCLYSIKDEHELERRYDCAGVGAVNC